MILSTPRAAHAAIALADGDVLFIGGCVEDSCKAGPASRTIDRFEWSSGLIAPAGDLLEERVTMAAASLPDGRVMIAGGWAGAAVTGSVDLYDPRTKQTRRAGRLAEPRADIAQATLRDGKILLAGGYRDGRALDLVELFDPASLTVKSVGRLRVARAGAGAALLADGRVIIVGGAENGPNGLVPSAAAEIFAPDSGRITPAGALATARYKHAAVSLKDGRVLVVGGSDSRDRGGKIRTLEAYDLATNRFVPAGETITARYKIGAAVVVLPDSRVLIAGGASRPEIYDPATGRSRSLGPVLGEALNFSTANLLPDGSVLVAGGYSEDGIKVRNRVWKLDPLLWNRTK